MRSSAAEWDTYLQARVKQRFTAAQIVTTQYLAAPEGDVEGNRTFSGFETIDVNPAFFQRLDGKLDALNAAGLLAVPALLWAAEWTTPAINATNPGLTLPEAQAILLARYQVARWVTCETGAGAAADERELKRFIDGNAHRVAYDAVDAPTVLVEYAPELRAIESNWPKIKFHALREHAGLVFQKRLEG